MTGRLLILGCGGHGRVLADTALDCGYSEIAFLDDAARPPARDGAQILGPISLLNVLSQDWPTAIVAIGTNAVRLELFQLLERLAFRVPNIVHPSAVVSRRASLGRGVFVAAGAVINVGARVGDAAIINTGACVDHDCIIGPGSHIAPGATLSGNVTVGAKSWLGTGCSVRQAVTIGDNVLIGVGAAVVSDLESGQTYVGNPARIHNRQPLDMPSA